MADFTNVVFFYNAAAQRWLNGEPSNSWVTSKASIMTAIDGCDLTGTEWQLNVLSDGDLSIQCVAVTTYGRTLYLDGRTVDGGVGLAPSTDPNSWSGTHWNPIAQGDGTFVFSCQGTSNQSQYRNLQMLADGTVRLASITAPVDPTVIWTLYTLTPATPPSGQ